MSGDREHLAASEAQEALAHYELGALLSARELSRGSRRSPKLLIQTAAGTFLLKRRAARADRLERAAFSHELTRHLAERGLPVPRLIATRDGRTLLELDQRLFEMYEYMAGEPYDASLSRTTSAGQMLARLHAAGADFQSGRAAPEHSYHDLPAVRAGLNSIPSVTSGHDSVIGREAELLAATQWLHERYDEAAAEANALGFGGWPRGVIHGDWHPGNLLFSGPRVRAVLDLESARRAPRVVDVANGMLQFSIIRGGEDPLGWPAFFDEARARRFLLGYQTEYPLPREQRSALPHLMLESLIAESVVPIAATGSFGRMPGFGVLMMVRRKVQWLLNNRADMLRWSLEE